MIVGKECLKLYVYIRGQSVNTVFGEEEEDGEDRMMCKRIRNYE
jgi:hypothetical protein